MNYTFQKWQGCGNDFLFVDAMQRILPLEFTSQDAVVSCDRHFGVGADGAAVLKEDDQADARWDFYNCDGSAAEMCGNAARCAIYYLHEKYFPKKEIVTLKTLAGIVKGRKLAEGRAEVSMPVSVEQALRYEEKVIQHEGNALRLYVMDTGVPHAVIEVDSLSKAPILEVGKFLLKHPMFGDKGTNVSFFQRVSVSEIIATTVERGVGKETLACGTGVVATALLYAELYLQKFPIRVHVPGGEMSVSLSTQKNAVLLEGPVSKSFEADFNCSIHDYKKIHLSSEVTC